MNRTTHHWLANPWTYFAATFAWTWLFWGLVVALGLSMESGGGFLLLAIGVTGPTLTGIAFTYLTRDREGRRDYWRRVIDVRRIPAAWFAVILLFALAVNLSAAGVDLLLGGAGGTWGEAVTGFVESPLSLVFAILFATLVPLLEELGWRGYVLDRLQERGSALRASLVLGVVWTLWHLPLFFVEGSYQSGLGIGTLEFWLFMVGIVPLTLVFTWIYNNTGRSILAAILFHAMINFSGELVAVTPRADTISTAVWIVAAIVITVVWGAKTLRRGPGGPTSDPARTPA